MKDFWFVQLGKNPEFYRSQPNVQPDVLWPLSHLSSANLVDGLHPTDMYIGGSEGQLRLGRKFPFLANYCDIAENNMIGFPFKVLI